MRHGHGTYIAVDGSFYAGYWLYDKMSGEGMKVHSDGSVYIGRWQNNQ